MLCVPLFGDQPINARQLEVFVIFLLILWNHCNIDLATVRHCLKLQWAGDAFSHSSAPIFSCTAQLISSHICTNYFSTEPNLSN